MGEFHSATLYYWAMKYWGCRYKYGVKSWRARNFGTLDVLAWVFFGTVDVPAHAYFVYVQILAWRYFGTVKGMLWHCEVLTWEYFSTTDILVGPSAWKNIGGYYIAKETASCRHFSIRIFKMLVSSQCHNFPIHGAVISMFPKHLSWKMPQCQVFMVLK